MIISIAIFGQSLWFQNYLQIPSETRYIQQNFITVFENTKWRKLNQLKFCTYIKQRIYHLKIYPKHKLLQKHIYYSLSKKDTICFTISEGLLRSMRRLCILISYLDQVLDPSPQGVFLDVILNVLVGRRTGPLTASLLLLAPLIRSAQTFSKLRTFLLVNVILILWIGASSSWTCFSLYTD